MHAVWHFTEHGFTLIGYENKNVDRCHCDSNADVSASFSELLYQCRSFNLRVDVQPGRGMVVFGHLCISQEVVDYVDIGEHDHRHGSGFTFSLVCAEPSNTKQDILEVDQDRYCPDFVFHVGRWDCRCLARSWR